MLTTAGSDTVLQELRFPVLDDFGVPRGLPVKLGSESLAEPWDVAECLRVRLEETRGRGRLAYKLSASKC